MQALVLDFDGVISDSAREAFAVAQRTYAELVPDSSVAAGLAQLDTQRPEAASGYARFLEIMPLGNRAEDYAVTLVAIERELEVADQAAYDELKAGIDPEWLRSFHKRFYKVRAGWRKADPSGWLDLIAPYPEVVRLLRRRAGEVELAIATAKDRHSVHELLAHYGIDDLFPPGRVLDKETGEDKRAHLAHLEEQLGLPGPELTFVDDKVNHLESVSQRGVRCALAAWGYNALREQRRARELGHLVCELADVEAQLFG